MSTLSLTTVFWLTFLFGGWPMFFFIFFGSLWKGMYLTKDDRTALSYLLLPGIGPITALCAILSICNDIVWSVFDKIRAFDRKY